ncbi:MAG: radical SAM protein [Thermodesulfobacteriota bacterium]
MQKTVSFTRHSANVFFHILTRCNLRCRHCYINPDQHGKADLDTDTIVDWLSLFHQAPKKSNLILLGGEPTLHPGLPEVVKAARRIGYESVTIDTNGYLFNDILEKVTPAEVDYFSFSLDGATPETNDRIRGAGCFARCTEGIRRAAAGGFSVSVIYTVSSENAHELPMMIPLLTALGVRRFFIQVIGIRGRSAEVESLSAEKPLQLTKSRWEALVPPVARQAADAGIATIYPKVFLAPGETFECAGNVADNYFIFPNGRVYRCPLCEDYPLHAMTIVSDRLVPTGKINEADLFTLSIPEGCVINKLVQGGNIEYGENGAPQYQIACCLLKEEVSP